MGRVIASALPGRAPEAAVTDGVSQFFETILNFI